MKIKRRIIDFLFSDIIFFYKRLFYFNDIHLDKSKIFINFLMQASAVYYVFIYRFKIRKSSFEISGNLYVIALIILVILLIYFFDKFMFDYYVKSVKKVVRIKDKFLPKFLYYLQFPLWNFWLILVVMLRFSFAVSLMSIFLYNYNVMSYINTPWFLLILPYFAYMFIRLISISFLIYTSWFFILTMPNKRGRYIQFMDEYFKIERGLKDEI